MTGCAGCETRFNSFHVKSGTAVVFIQDQAEIRLVKVLFVSGLSHTLGSTAAVQRTYKIQSISSPVNRS